MFHLGQQVVCIWDEWHPTNHIPPIPVRFPIAGMVYTIRKFAGDEDVLCVRLEEIVNTSYMANASLAEPCFEVEGFRPVKKTSIEVFQKLLAPIEPELVE